MTGAAGLYLNFYGPGTITAPLPNGTPVTLTQHTAYPVQGNITLVVGVAQPAAFTLHVRIPSWSHATTVTVNGAAVDRVQPGSYLPLARTWQDGDRVEIAFDMTLHFWHGERECAGKVSIYRGPLLLAYDQRYNAFDAADLPVLDLTRLAYEPTAWSGPLPPWLLLRFELDNGTPLILCDFANAGMAGTEYRSWLPVAAGTKIMLAPGTPQWCGQLARS